LVGEPDRKGLCHRDLLSREDHALKYKRKILIKLFSSIIIIFTGVSESHSKIEQHLLFPMC
jgi:hypothetical protein